MLHHPPTGPHALTGRGPFALFRHMRPRRGAARRGGPGETLGSFGSLEVRLAADRKDIRRAQRLRYEVFFEEGGATPDLAGRLHRRDCDPFDDICDHLLILDHDRAQGSGRKPELVGTCRLLPHEAADRHGGFYSAGEFDVGSLEARQPQARFLELGRSCIRRSHRDRSAVNLLWTGIWAYVRRRRFDAMIGCASLEGVAIGRLALPLSFLHHHAQAPEPWRVQALPHRRLAMDLIPRHAVDPREAARRLPPLLKGYLRLGAFVGDGAVIDHAFGTTDVFVVLPVVDIAARYISRFGPPQAGAPTLTAASCLGSPPA